MRQMLAALAGALALFTACSTARALCIYHGKLYAKTSLEQEFRDATVVVRGVVVSSKNIYPSDDSDDSDPGVLYRVKVEQSFKGKPPAMLTDYTERNSGGFYLDLGTEYLLFLNPITPKAEREFPSWKKNAPDALTVNYNCGQSRPWGEVSAEDRRRLGKMSDAAK